jgi:hypothetical protein
LGIYHFDGKLKLGFVMKKDKDIYYSAKAVEIVFTVIDAQFGFV